MDRRGVRVAGKIFTLNGQKYYLGKDGKAITGIVKRSGKYYFYDPQTGYMRTNFKQVTSRGTIFYYGKDGVQVRRAFVPIVENGKRNVYYFGYNGKAYKGWHKINGKKYYFYGGKGPKAGTRAQNVRLVSSGGVVSVFNKYGILKYQFKKK